MYVLIMKALIGYTGFVGGHLQENFEFDHKFNSSNINEIKGLDTEFLVCAGLPAAKWKANTDPVTDYSNMTRLAQTLTTVQAKTAVLISTIDVYQPAFEVTEEDLPSYDGEAAYGRNRAWFELFFYKQFTNSIVIRLPGLFANNLRKNLIFDLMNKREDQWRNVSKSSTFQFFDVSKTGYYIDLCMKEGIKVLNVATEPVLAQDVADVFGVVLNESENVVSYNMKSIHSGTFSGTNGYLQHKNEVLEEISRLKEENEIINF